MCSLLVKNLQSIITCDAEDRVLSGVDLYCEDGFIRALGPNLPQKADTVLDGSHLWCYPGLVNTHHHLYQVFSRNLPQVQNMELFDWLTTLYEIWKGLDETVIRLSSLTGMGELMKHGCTTCFDHHYVFPAHAGDLIGAQLAAAEELGIRMFASRGSMDLSKKDGGLPPDSVVQTVDEIMRDSARIIEAYHDPRPGSMRQIALAPCSPFSVSAELLRQSALLARQYGVRLHTHLCETKDEEAYMLTHHGVRPLEFMASLGWTGPDVWYAHGIHFNDEELRELARTGTGVAHCPISNMKLSSGVARIPEMLALGVPVGLAVDGSASNDGSSLLEELRVCYLLHRLHSSKAAPSGYQVLKMATRGSARLLGREDIGSLEVGKCADFFLVDSRRLELVGGEYSPADVLATVGLRGPVDYTVVAGKITVKEGHLVTIDEVSTGEQARRCCREYLSRSASSLRSHGTQAAFLCPSVQHLDSGAQHAVADVDAEGAVDLTLPDVVVIRQSRRQLLAHQRHAFRCAAVGHRQVVPLVTAAGLHRQVHQLVHHLVSPPDLGHGGQLAILGKGKERLDLQQHPCRGGDFADAPALLQVFQGIHGEEGMGPRDELWCPPLRQFLPVHPVPDILRQLQHGHAQAQGATDGVKGPDLQLAPAFLRHQPQQVIGAGQAAGEHDGDHAVIAFLMNAGQQLQDLLRCRQGGLGQFSRPQAAINVFAPDIHAVQVFPVSAQNAQGDHENMVLLRQLGRQIGAGICQDRDLPWIHNSFFHSFAVFEHWNDYPTKI